MPQKAQTVTPLSKEFITDEFRNHGGLGDDDQNTRRNHEHSSLRPGYLDVSARNPFLAFLDLISCTCCCDSASKSLPIKQRRIHKSFRGNKSAPAVRERRNDCDVSDHCVDSLETFEGKVPLASLGTPCARTVEHTASTRKQKKNSFLRRENWETSPIKIRGANKWRTRVKESDATHETSRVWKGGTRNLLPRRIDEPCNQKIEGRSASKDEEDDDFLFKIEH